MNKQLMKQSIQPDNDVVGRLARFSTRKIRRNFFNQFVKNKTEQRVYWQQFNRIISKRHTEIYG